MSVVSLRPCRVEGCSGIGQGDGALFFYPHFWTGAGAVLTGVSVDIGGIVCFVMSIWRAVVVPYRANVIVVVH